MIRVLERLARWAAGSAQSRTLVETGRVKSGIGKEHRDSEGWVAERLRRLQPPNTWRPDPGKARQRLAQRMSFEADGRSRTLVFVAHCVLNQNARDAGTADFPAMMKPLVDELATRNIGVIQLPCPELMVLGLGRARDSSPLQTIRERLETTESHARLDYLVEQVVYQIREYQAQGFRIVGILGKNGSPTCGVQTTSHMIGSPDSEGVFIRLLKQRLESEGLDICIKGIDDHRQQKAVEWILNRISDEAIPR